MKGAGQVRSAERPTASVAEVAKAVQEVPERYRLAILLPAWCQLRRGEILGLQRRDVDLVHRTVRGRAGVGTAARAEAATQPSEDARRRPNLHDLRHSGLT